MLLPSSTDANSLPVQHLTTFLINDRFALDAGSLGFYGTPERQASVKNVVITHSHIDHTASLSTFLDNVYDGSGDCVTIWGSEAVLDSLRRDCFNDRVWPDLLALAPASAPFFRLKPLHSGVAVEIAGLRVTPIEVDHVVPTLGVLVDDGMSAVLFPSDTGPTEEIWRLANRTPHLKAVFLEASFPNDQQALADLAKHLTPVTFSKEVRKLVRPTKVYAIHLKARFRDTIATELAALNIPGVQVVQPGHVYDL
jgi:cAMP phosphodiesterase